MLLASDAVEKLAVKFCNELREKLKIEKKASLIKTDSVEDKAIEADFENINLKAIKHDEVREVGTEWLCLQAIRELGLDTLLANSSQIRHQENRKSI